MGRIVHGKAEKKRKEPKNSIWKSVPGFLATLVGAAAVVAAFSWLWFVKLHNDLPKTTLLKIRNDAWVARMEVIRHKLDLYEENLAGIEARNNDVYRSIFALDPVADTLARDSSKNEMEVLIARLDAVQKRIDRQMAAMGEVALVAKKAGDMVSCIPAVPPVLPKKGSYHLSSPFGTRTDPIFGTIARHTGQDIATKIGNPVYATGDGVVEKVDFKYTGYGNEVVIDHGFGYKTRYAHLNTIDVGVGQALHRGDKIGEVGKSGKSTGPHLHYEVLYKNDPVNPMSFMDMTMPVEEYRAMIVKRKMEKDGGTRPSVSDFGKRQKKQGTNGRK